MKEEEIYEISADHENRQNEIREEYEKREELLGEELQVKMKAVLAENVRNMTEKLIQV